MATLVEIKAAQKRSADIRAARGGGPPPLSGRGRRPTLSSILDAVQVQARRPPRPVGDVEEDFLRGTRRPDPVWPPPQDPGPGPANLTVGDVGSGGQGGQAGQGFPFPQQNQGTLQDYGNMIGQNIGGSMVQGAFGGFGPGGQYIPSTAQSYVNTVNQAWDEQLNANADRVNKLKLARIIMGG